MLGPLSSGSARAGGGVQVFLNGVLITGYRDFRFTGVDVVLDANGNLNIVGPRYGTQEGTPPPSSPPPGKGSVQPPSPPSESNGMRPPPEGSPAVPGALPPVDSSLAQGEGSGEREVTGRYWVVSRESRGGGTGYEVEVLVNGISMGTFRAREGTLVADVTPFVRRGENRIRFLARKMPGTPADAGAPGLLDLYLGTGERRQGEVVLDQVHLQYTRRASESQSFDSEMRFTAR